MPLWPQRHPLPASIPLIKRPAACWGRPQSPRIFTKREGFACLRHSITTVSIVRPVQNQNRSPKKIKFKINSREICASFFWIRPSIVRPAGYPNWPMNFGNQKKSKKNGAEANAWKMHSLRPRLALTIPLLVWRHYLFVLKFWILYSKTILWSDQNGHTIAQKYSTIQYYICKISKKYEIIIQKRSQNAQPFPAGNDRRVWEFPTSKRLTYLGRHCLPVLSRIQDNQ